MAQLTHQFDLVRLNAFMVVTEEGSITGAAIRLNVSQPALSATIQRLEADLGQLLFIRQSRGVILTRAGRNLLPYAYEIFGILEQAHGDLNEIHQQLHGEVSIGMPPSVAIVAMRPLLHHLSENFPEVSVRMVESMSGYLYEWVEAGDLDIAFTFNNIDTQTVMSRPLFSEEVMLIGICADIADQPNPFPVSQLAELPLILTSGRHQLRNLLDNQVRAFGKRLNIRYEIDAGQELVRLVSSGAGFGVFARSAFLRELAEGKVATRELDPSYTRMVCLTQHRRKKADRIVSVIAESVTELCHDLRRNKFWP